jgi:rhodanese-related sulfurtransferase
MSPSNKSDSSSGIPGTLRLALKEGLFILFSAVLLGLAYTAISEKGLFGPPSAPMEYSLPEADRSPETITLDEAQDLHFSEKAVFIDTRGDTAYRAGHIPGAINIPLPELEQEVEFLKEVSLGKVLIPYCDGSACHSSVEFSTRLMASGISNIKVFFGGWEEWTAARLPTAIPRS